MLPYEPLPPPPHDRPAQVTLRMSDGRRVHAECLSARGGSDRPFPPEVLDEKIALLVEPVYPRFGRVAASLMRLEETRMAQAWRRIVDDLCEDAR